MRIRHRGRIARIRRLPTACVLPVCVLTTCLLAACDGTSRLPKPPGSVLWVEPDGLEATEPDDLDRLREAGIGELFVAGAELRWDGDRPRIEPGGAISLPRRAPVTLVASGRWRRGAAESERFGALLGEQLQRLRLTAEGRGLLVVGIHLDLRELPATELEAFAEGLEEAIGGVGEGRYLSLELDRRWLGGDEVERLTEEVDFVTCRLYGQPIGVAEDGSLWRHDRVLETVERLEELGEDYLIGVVTTGGLRRYDSAGKVVATASGSAGLAELVRHPALDRYPGGVLEGLDRRVMLFAVDSPAAVGEWRLGAGERVQTVQVREHDLRRLLDRLRRRGPAHHLGELYIRAPRSEERLALSLEALASAAGGEPRMADLQAELREVRAVRGGLAFRVAVANGGQIDTDVAYLESNYLDVEVPGGVVTSARAGGFQRYERRSGGRPATTDMRSFRNADSVRMFVPMLEAGESVVSGPIVVRTTSGRVRLGGRFALPSGEIFELPEAGIP